MKPMRGAPGWSAGLAGGDGGVVVYLHVGQAEPAQLFRQQLRHLMLPRRAGQGGCGGVALAGHRQVAEETFGELFGNRAGHRNSSRLAIYRF